MGSTGLMLTGEPSRTARAVAAVRVHAPRVPAAHGNPAAADAFERLVAGDLEVTDSPMAAYLTARTWFFDQVVVDAIDSGVRQIVTAAAGYDTRALRYAAEGVRWLELDHPATQADKQARLLAAGIDVSHIAFAAADFTVDDVASRLVAAGCDPSERSLVLAEGIAVYLEPPILRSLLGALRSAVAAGSRLAISMSLEAESTDRQLRRAAFQERVAALGEPARNVLTAADSVGLLAETGWQIDAPMLDPAGAPGRTGLVTALAVG
jgi:methyltransferase (TIGR00027 family)